jgi:hypothetical protein
VAGWRVEQHLGLLGRSKAAQSYIGFQRVAFGLVILPSETDFPLAGSKPWTVFENVSLILIFDSFFFVISFVEEKSAIFHDGCYTLLYFKLIGLSVTQLALNSCARSDFVRILLSLDEIKWPHHVRTRRCRKHANFGLNKFVDRVATSDLLCHWRPSALPCYYLFARFHG